MKRTMILRFRDLVTEEGGTISEHSKLIQRFGGTWWGWWARTHEVSPRSLFQELSTIIQNEDLLVAFLFDAGTHRFYAAQVSRIMVAPSGHKINTPDPELTPSYCHRGSYPAWFLLKGIQEVSFPDLKFRYDSFPTRPELTSLGQLLGQRIPSLEQLGHIDATLISAQSDG